MFNLSLGGLCVDPADINSLWCDGYLLRLLWPSEFGALGTSDDCQNGGFVVNFTHGFRVMAYGVICRIICVVMYGCFTT